MHNFTKCEFLQLNYAQIRPENPSTVEVDTYSYMTEGLCLVSTKNLLCKTA